MTLPTQDHNLHPEHSNPLARDAGPDMRLHRALHAGVGRMTLDEILTVFWDEQDAHVLEALTWALAQYGEGARRELLTGLSHSHPEVRRRSVHALGKLPQGDITSDLLPLLSDPSESVLAKTIMVLGQRHDPRALPHLLEFLGDTRTSVLVRTLDALENYGDLATTSLLDYTHDPRALVRERSVDLLGFLKNPELISYLAPLLEDHSPHVRSSALLALDASLRALPDLPIGEDALRHEEGMTLLFARLLDPQRHVRLLAERLWSHHDPASGVSW